MWGSRSTTTNIRPYNLYLQRMNNPDSLSPFTFGETVSGSLSAAESDTYTFVGVPGDVVLVRSLVLNPSVEIAFSRIFDPDGDLLCESKLRGVIIEMFCTLNESGTHTTLVGRALGRSSPKQVTYSLYIERMNMPANLRPIDVNQILSGSMSYSAGFDTFSFIGREGENIVIKVDIASEIATIELRVYRPDGTLICTTNRLFVVSIAEEACALDAPGSHTILVSISGSKGTIDYTINLVRS